jgi:hypothetical protein
MLAIPLHGLPNYALADLALPVLAVAPLSVDATADSATVTGTTVGVDATPANGTAPYAYAWTVTSEPSVGAAVFDDDAIAGPTVTFSEAGSYTFSVTVTDDDAATATDTVSVTVVQTAAGITVSPATQSLYPLTARQFTQSQVDQFGDAMGSPEAVTWSVDGGGVGGSVNSSGLYTAPAADGADVVRVITNTTGLVATAAVTVLPPAEVSDRPPLQLLLSTIKNISASREYYDFLPPSGGYMEPAAELQFFGNVYDWVRKGDAHHAALDHALTQGKLSLVNSTGRLIRDTVTGETLEVSLAAGVLTVVIPSFVVPPPE